MPIANSSKKSLRSSLAKKKMNLEWKKKLRDVVRDFLKNLDEKSLSKLYSVLDKMVKRKIVNKNKVARLKSRYNKKMKKTERKKVAVKKTVEKKKK